MVQSYSFWGISKVNDIRKLSFTLCIIKKGRILMFSDISYDDFPTVVREEVLNV